MEGLQEAYDADTDGIMANPGNVNCKVWVSSNRLTTFKQALPEDILREAIPGNIRKAEHFIAFLKRFVEYLKVSCFLKCPYESDSFIFIRHA